MHTDNSRVCFFKGISKSENEEEKYFGFENGKIENGIKEFDLKIGFSKYALLGEPMKFGNALNHKDFCSKPKKVKN